MNERRLTSWSKEEVNLEEINDDAWFKEQLDFLPYPQQLKILYSQWFTPHAFSGESQIIPFFHKDGTKMLLLLKWEWVFRFGDVVVCQYIEAISYFSGIVGFWIQSKWRYYLFRFDWFKKYLPMIQNAFSPDGGFSSKEELDRGILLYLSPSVSDDIVDILTGERY